MTSTIDPKAIGKPAPRARRHVRSLTGYLPETDESGNEKWPRGDEKTWKENMRSLETDVPGISRTIVHHVQTSLARQAYNLDNLGAYQAAALSVRDNLILNWNDTQLQYTRKEPKRAYYLSLEFLMGRALDNAVLNLDLKQQYKESTEKLGFNMEDLLEQERDAGAHKQHGDGAPLTFYSPRKRRPRSPGRLLPRLIRIHGKSPCILPRVTSHALTSLPQELPVWGYGLRYKYGIFQQLISPEGQQLEAPDPWLENQNPWELPRLDVQYEVRFYGSADRLNDGTPRAIWSGGQEVIAQAYDVMIPGCFTKSTNNLRLWESKPKRGFDLNSFNAGDYERAVESSNSASAITSVLYPNDHTTFGKELRLKQQYFWTAASLADMMRRFKNIGKPITQFPDYVAIQLNDTHPTMAIPELMRILVDEEDVPWDTAWQITTNTFFYTNHTVLPEALE
ncbi:carbohydrate phosphorylase-domain-containing protein, partial [Schizophyllum fasciatum]